MKREKLSIIQWLKRNNEKDSSSFILLVRHAEKEKYSEISKENLINLTKYGRKEALAFGRELSLLNNRIQYIKTSPIKRCVTTAEFVLQGTGHNLKIITSTKLGDPGVFITDDKVAVKHFKNYSCEEVVQFQIKGMELDGIRDLKNGSELLLNEIYMDLNSNKGSGLYVSHDAIIVPFIYYLTGDADIVKKWINFLDGAYIWFDESRLFLLWDGKRYEITNKLSINKG